jgi:hypothetical protein
LFGPSSACVQQLVATAQGECDTLDHGFSVAKKHGLEMITKKYTQRAKIVKKVDTNDCTGHGKRKRGRGVASKRLKHAKTKEKTNHEELKGDKDCVTPTKDSKEVVFKHTTREFEGHFEGRCKGRLLYRPFTQLASVSNVAGHDAVDDATADNIAILDADKNIDESKSTRYETMKVEHFALCRYLSLLSSDISQQGNPNLRAAVCTYQQQHKHLNLLKSYGHTMTRILSDCGKNSDNVALILDGLTTYLGSGTVGSTESRGIYRRCTAVQDDETFSSVWKSRGPGAWAHALVRSDRNDEEGHSVTWLGSYCEGSIWLTLMMMLFYDEIFSTRIPLGKHYSIILTKM